MWKLDYKESWAPKNWCFWTVVLEKTLENPLDCKRSNQPILKIISPEYSLEGLMLKLKLQYFGHLMRRADSGENPDAGKYWRQEEKGKTEDEMARWHQMTQWTWDFASPGGSWWWTGKPGKLQSKGLQRVGCDWTELNMNKYLYYYPITHCKYLVLWLAFYLSLPHRPSAPEK